MTYNDNLLPCPFCGGKAELRKKNRTIINHKTVRNCYVLCKECDSRGGRFIYTDDESTEITHLKAIEAWNMRSEMK